MKVKLFRIALMCCLLVLVLSSPRLSFSENASPSIKVSHGQYKSALLINADTGEVLYQKNPHMKLPPASMVKMMIMLLVMEKLEVKSIFLTDPVKTSAKASKYGGSQVYLKHGEVFPLEEMMKAMVIHSANDASVAVAEYLTGSIEGAVDLMNRRSRELGMKNTIYYSVDGLPPRNGDKPDLSTAFDLAILARELIKYPKLLEWTSTKTAPFRDGQFILTNTNKLIESFRGADGLKTGYYRKAGYNLTATASRDGLRMISVVMGVPNGKGRFQESARLLSTAFNMYKKIHVVTKGEPIEPNVEVTGSKKKKTVLVAADDVYVHVRRNRESSVHAVLSVPEEIEAPLSKGKAYGKLLIKNGDTELARVDALAQEEIPEAPFYYQLLYRLF